MKLTDLLNRNTLIRLRRPFAFRKGVNYLRNNYERRQGRLVLTSYPWLATLNTTNLCNLRCKFCEIHYFYEKASSTAGRVFPNNLTPEILSCHEPWLRSVISAELTGATGEPFVNPHIMDVIRYLKKLGISLAATTNALLIDDDTAGQLIDAGFDSLLVSVHAGDAATYQELQGGDYELLLDRLESLIRARNRRRAHRPLVGLNFALNQLNAAGLPPLMKTAKELGVDSLVINHYYSSRNLIGEDISYYRQPETCNKLLAEAYAYGQELGLNIVPPRPSYLNAADISLPAASHPPCAAPWTTIKFKGCVEFENSEYIGVCNRIILFRMNYREYCADPDHDFKRDVWNSDVFQYLRQTVNSAESNPVCRLCKDPATPQLRSLDTTAYSRRRDEAILSFFERFQGTPASTRRVRGLTLLSENPYRYDEHDRF